MHKTFFLKQKIRYKQNHSFPDEQSVYSPHWDLSLVNLRTVVWFKQTKQKLNVQQTWLEAGAPLQLLQLPQGLAQLPHLTCKDRRGQDRVGPAAAGPNWDVVGGGGHLPLMQSARLVSCLVLSSTSTLWV